MADEKKGSSSRTYHVLQRYASDEGWDTAATIEASSAEQAIRLTAADNGAGRYVAIPERSWTELTVRVEVPAPRIIVEGLDDAPPQSLKAAAAPDDDEDAAEDEEDLTDDEVDRIFATAADDDGPTRIMDDPPPRAQQRRQATRSE